MKKEEKAVLDLLLKMFQKYIAFLSTFALYTSLEPVYTPFIDEKELRLRPGFAVWKRLDLRQVFSA